MEPLDATTKLALLRDELLKFGIFPFLNSGTLLGWYRECTIIPHTRDMDLAIFIEDFRQEYFDSIGKEQSAFKLKRKLGMVELALRL
uniref:Uncharacterized protein n=1 Tax=Caenorhabditis japonica TaxID=281687 RepID=A0A8R1HK34_CAEJA